MKVSSVVIGGMMLCGSAITSLAHAQTKGPIGISMPTKAAVHWVHDGENMVKLLKERGYRTELQNAEDSVANQIDQIQKMIDMKVKVLVIGAIDGSKLGDVLQRAHDQRIRIIAYDRLIRGSANVDYYAGFDNFQVGVLQGSYIEKALNLKGGKGPFNIEVFGGSIDDNNSAFFYNGALSVLKNYIDQGTLVVRSKQLGLEKVATPRWDNPTAMARMDKLLATYYTQQRVDAVLSPNDGIAIAVLTALKRAGYGAAGQPIPVVTGQDSDLPSVKSIIRGEQASTIFKDTRELAEVTSNMADAMGHGRQPIINDTKSYDNGVKIVPSFLLKPAVVDKSNYREVLITNSNFYTDAELR